MIGKKECAYFYIEGVKSLIMLQQSRELLLLLLLLYERLKVTEYDRPGPERRRLGFIW